MSMKVIPKMFTRDFTVLLCQIWGRRYNSFFGVELKTFPRQVCVFHNKLVSIYRNVPVLHQEINAIFKEKAAEHPKFFTSFASEYLEKAKVLKVFIDNKTITRENLLFFADALCELWQGLYASLFIAPDEDFDSVTRETALAFRHKTEKLEYTLFNFIEKALRKLYPTLGDRVKYIAWEELGLNKIPPAETLQARANELIILGDKVIVKEAFEKIQKQCDFILESEEYVTGHTTLKGQVAFRGTVTGVVRKILKVSDLSSFLENEVLVSYMTISDFLPAMMKASAFVTDEGGITCHAAIAARELKKPCIIGTKIATQVLKDGDMVEVKADHGLVIILK